MFLLQKGMNMYELDEVMFSIDRLKELVENKEDFQTIQELELYIENINNEVETLNKEYKESTTEDNTTVQTKGEDNE